MPDLPPGLLPARLQMAFTLGFHIVFACLGVGLPVLMLAAEGLFLAGKEEAWRTLAKRWSKAFSVLFAVGAVSGTVLSFEMGLLWPEFMGRFGAAIGLAFTLEAFAFFLEAIFVGIYLYAWDKLTPRQHFLAGVPIALSGFASAWFVVTANAWMNSPQGFAMLDGKLVDVDPLAAMLNDATWAQTTHMIVAAYMVAGFLTAGYYAARLLSRNLSDIVQSHCRRGLALGLALGCVFAPIQGAVGHWSAEVVAATQPVKLAAMEGQFQTERRAPLRIGGLPDVEARETRWAIEIPGLLSWLAHGDVDAEVVGLDEFPRELQPPVVVVHLAFQVMVGIGSALMLLAAWCAWSLIRKRALPSSRFFLWCVAASGPLTVVAMEAGWIVTEVGRQPWIVQGIMLTRDAVSDAPGLWHVFAGAMATYAALTFGTIAVLRRLAAKPLPEEAGADASTEERHA